MTVNFVDHSSIPAAQVFVRDESQLVTLLGEVAGRGASLAELVGDNGYKLLVGVSPTLGCAQHSASSGEPPYSMALADQRDDDGEGVFDFRLENSVTSIPMRYCLPMDRVKSIAIAFFLTGGRSKEERWEDI